MPNIVRHGVTLTEALQEAAAAAPLQRAMLLTYELWHPTLAAPVRFVNDRAALLATLEATAPRNASEEVEFLAAYPITFERPEESDQAGTPRLKIGRPDVSGLWKAAADAARGSRASWILIERLYASDDTSAPAKLPPLTLEVESSAISGPDLGLTASFDDEVNTAIPAIHYTRQEYPGLQR